MNQPRVCALVSVLSIAALQTWPVAARSAPRLIASHQAVEGVAQPQPGIRSGR